MFIATAGFFSPEGKGPEFLLALAVLGGAWTFVKAIPKVTGGIARADRAVRQIVGDDDTPGLGERISKVEAELKPNGGGSMRDALNRVERGVDDAKNVATNVEAKLMVSQQTQAIERAKIADDIRRSLAAVDVLMGALDQYAKDTHSREVAYVKALKHFNIDLTDVAEHLEEGSGDGT